VDLTTGELVYDGTSQELRDFVTYFAEAFKAGYIDPDYSYAQMFDQSLQISGAVALFGGMDRDLTSFKESYDLDLKAVHMTYPEGFTAPKEYSYEYAKQRTSGMKNIVVTTSCQDPETAVQFLDWFYSTDGASAVNFGFNEGESYEVVDGVKQWLPFMTERDENLVNYEVIYSLDEGPGFQLVNKKCPVSADYVLEAKEIWLDYDPDQALFSATPTLSFTAKESEDMSAVNSDISTYVSTEISKFMMGQTELNDDTWNAYVETVESMGLADLQGYYETAYARYEDR
jgi:putative aldouronate transport system substrate-binding protein